MLVSNEKILYVAVNHTERYADPEEQVRAEFWAELIYRYGYEPARIGVEIIVPDRTPSDRADLVVFRDDERKKPYAVIECKADGVTDAEFNQAVEQACGNGTVAQASAPAGGGSVPLPVHGRATYRGGTPLEPAAATAALRSNDIQPVSKEALIGAIKKCHQNRSGKPHFNARSAHSDTGATI